MEKTGAFTSPGPSHLSNAKFLFTENSPPNMERGGQAYVWEGDSGFLSKVEENGELGQAL